MFASLLPSLPSHRPNILFIMSDDHAAAALSCYADFVKSHLKGVVQTPTKKWSSFGSLPSPCKA